VAGWAGGFASGDHGHGEALGGEAESALEALGAALEAILLAGAVRDTRGPRAAERRFRESRRPASTSRPSP
jgi:hypothetical protein